MSLVSNLIAQLHNYPVFVASVPCVAARLRGYYEEEAVAEAAVTL